MSSYQPTQLNKNCQQYKELLNGLFTQTLGKNFTDAFIVAGQEELDCLLTLLDTINPVVVKLFYQNTTSSLYNSPSLSFPQLWIVLYECLLKAIAEFNPEQDCAEIKKTKEIAQALYNILTTLRLSRHKEGYMSAQNAAKVFSVLNLAPGSENDKVIRHQFFSQMKTRLEVIIPKEKKVAGYLALAATCGAVLAFGIFSLVMAGNADLLINIAMIAVPSIFLATALNRTHHNLQERKKLHAKIASTSALILGPDNFGPNAIKKQAATDSPSFTR